MRPRAAAEVGRVQGYGRTISSVNAALIAIAGPVAEAVFLEGCDWGDDLVPTLEDLIAHATGPGGGGCQDMRRVPSWMKTDAFVEAQAAAITADRQLIDALAEELMRKRTLSGRQVFAALDQR